MAGECSSHLHANGFDVGELQDLLLAHIKPPDLACAGVAVEDEGLIEESCRSKSDEEEEHAQDDEGGPHGDLLVASAQIRPAFPHHHSLPHANTALAYVPRSMHAGPFHANQPMRPKTMPKKIERPTTSPLPCLVTIRSSDPPGSTSTRSRQSQKRLGPLP
jgi:hypothetical protein